MKQQILEKMEQLHDNLISTPGEDWVDLYRWVESLPDEQPAEQKQTDCQPAEPYQKLFSHMSEQHNLTLLQSQMDDIIQIVREMDKPGLGPFRWPVPDGVEVVTRGGWKVEHLHEFPGNGFAGIINGFEGVYTWREDGRDFGQDIREFDLFLRPIERKVWVVEWEDESPSAYKTLDEAIYNSGKYATIYEATLKPVK